MSTFLYRIKNIPELAKADKEDCANGIDDDGDFLVDCEDPTCSEDEHCKGNSDKPEDPEQSTDPDDSNGDKPADPEQNTDSEEDADSASESCSATPQSQSRGSFAWALLLLCGGFAALRRCIKAHKT